MNRLLLPSGAWHRPVSWRGVPARTTTSWAGPCLICDETRDPARDLAAATTRPAPGRKSCCWWAGAIPALVPGDEPLSGPGADLCQSANRTFVVRVNVSEQNTAYPEYLGCPTYWAWTRQAAGILQHRAAGEGEEL